jgi:lipopolysaccharide/colanic/teichoic acid biosynthesis glycosyltransferase
MLAGTRATKARVQPKLVAKRLLDVIVSVVALVTFAPVFAGLWLTIKLDSPGPVIFRQWRVGKDGKVFLCLKFRTMVHKADETAHRDAISRMWDGQHLSDDVNAAYKLTMDIRITRAGRWIRRMSLDELPQLINVLRGEMSVVGPRPAIPYELEHFQAWHHERHSVKPGLTGLWQVRGRGRVGPDEMLGMDVEYARTWTIWTDLWLILLTLPAVLKARGAR